MNRKEAQDQIKSLERDKKDVEKQIDELHKRMEILKARKRMLVSHLFKYKRIDLTLKTVAEELLSINTPSKPSTEKTE